MEFKILRDINKEEFSFYTDCYFPKILHSNPEDAAKSLTIKDAEEAYTILKEVLYDSSENCKLLRDVVYKNKFTFEWYKVFFYALRRFFQFPDIDAECVKGPSEGKDEILYIYYPFYVLPSKNGYTTFHDESIVNDYNNTQFTYGKKSVESIEVIPNYVDLCRRAYIKECYEADAFKTGYPSWYELPVKLVEKYNPYLNRRVRICCEDQELKYYVAGASDNWEEVLGVPLEMDDIVLTLLYARP